MQLGAADVRCVWAGAGLQCAAYLGGGHIARLPAQLVLMCLSPALRNIFHTSVALSSLFVLKAPLNTNQPFFFHCLSRHT